MTLKVFGKQIKLTFESIAILGFEGIFDPNNWTIKIDRESDRKLHTTLHELFHATWLRTGLSQTKLPLEAEEIIVENLATAVEENFSTLIKIYKRKS